MKRVKVFSGVVVSNKGDKTIVVEIQQRKPHPLYKKVLWSRKKVMAHDERNEAEEGDKVEITGCRPLSRRKRFRLLRIVKR